MNLLQRAEALLGGKKPMANQAQQPQQGQPVMVTEEVQEAPQAPVSAAPQDVPAGRQAVPDAPADPSPAPEEDAPAEEAAPEKPQEDRSAYNCPDCAGEGLKDPYTLCPGCNGTGKR